jgi:hypothetical protein
VIKNEQQRTRPWDSLNAGRLNPAKKQPQRDTDDRMDDLAQQGRTLAQVDHFR